MLIGVSEVGGEECGGVGSWVGGAWAVPGAPHAGVRRREPRKMVRCRCSMGVDSAHRLGLMTTRNVGAKGKKTLPRFEMDGVALIHRGRKGG